MQSLRPKHFVFWHQQPCSPTTVLELSIWADPAIPIYYPSATITPWNSFQTRYIGSSTTNMMMTLEMAVDFLAALCDFPNRIWLFFELSAMLLKTWIEVLKLCRRRVCCSPNFQKSQWFNFIRVGSHWKHCNYLIYPWITKRYLDATLFLF